MPARASASPSARDWLIALNATNRLTRGVLCRLATCTDRWLGAQEDAGLPRLAASLGVPSEPLRRVLRLRANAVALADHEERRAEDHASKIITLLDTDYPPSLRELALPPPVLYLRGELPTGPAVAIIGSRRMDAYGREVAETFAGKLAAAGVIVVSGFAIGVDTVAHRAAVAQRGGRTIAVLGCGIDIDYPRGNRQLATAISSSNGASMSEFPLGALPRPWHFPVRNRVIAALSSCTLVIQAALKSGSLITAHHALELGRDIYAVPGRIFDELALGANALLADGAFVARTPDDLLDGLAMGQRELFQPSSTVPSTPAVPLPAGFPGKLLNAMPVGSEQTAEDIACRLDTAIDRVLAALLELELAGWLRRGPGPIYVR